MKLALIPPFSQLNYTYGTQYQLMLPQLFAAGNKEYRKTYADHCQSSEQFVILDNGVAEHVAFNTADLCSMAVSMRVNEVVAPDVLLDGQATIEATEAFLSQHTECLRYAAVGVMYVLQGRAFREYTEQIDYVKQHRDEFSSVALPRHMIKTLGTSQARMQVANDISYDLPGIPIHLLGASSMLPDEVDVFKGNWPDQVRGTDTSSPFNYAYAGELLDHGRRVDRPIDYFDLGADRFNTHAMTRNVSDLMRWCENA